MFFFGLSTDNLTNPHCETEANNVTSLPPKGMDTYTLVEDHLGLEHEFGSFWRQFGTVLKNLTWMHLPEFDAKLEVEDVDENQPMRTSIVGLGEGGVTVLVQDVTMPAAGLLTRCVTHFLGQTHVVSVVLHPENGRWAEHRSRVSTSENGEVVKIGYKEKVQNAMFGARCEAIVRYVNRGKRLDKLKGWVIPDDVVENARRELKRARSDCAALLGNLNPPDYELPDFSGEMTSFLAMFGVDDEEIVSSLLAGEMPQESALHNVWRVSMVRSGNRWSAPEVEIEMNECEAMLPAPETSEAVAKLRKEADAAIAGFQELVAKIPAIVACAQSFNRPVRVEE